MSPTTSVPTMTTGAVTLRALSVADLEGLVEQSTDPLSIRWTTVPVPYALADARRFALEIAPGAWADGSQWIFAVEAEGRYAGNVALRDEGAGRAEVAFGAHPWARGTGHLTTAVRMLLDWGFATRGVRRVVWRANVGNWGSRRLAWRLGFDLAGTLTDYQPHRGELVSAWVGTLGPGDPRRPRNPWLEAPTIDAGPVRLRALRTGDVERIVEACSDPDTSRWIDLPRPYGPDDALRWLDSAREQQATGRGTTWAVTDPGADLLLGAVNAFDVVAGRQAELGYWVHPDARGRGVARAAARAAIGHCAHELGLPRLRATRAAENQASGRVLEAVGFRRCGVERRSLMTGAGLADRVVYDLLAEELAEELAVRTAEESADEPAS